MGHISKQLILLTFENLVFLIADGQVPPGKRLLLHTTVTRMLTRTTQIQRCRPQSCRPLRALRPRGSRARRECVETLPPYTTTRAPRPLCPMIQRSTSPSSESPIAAVSLFCSYYLLHFFIGMQETGVLL